MCEVNASMKNIFIETRERESDCSDNQSQLKESKAKKFGSLTRRRRKIDSGSVDANI